MFLSAAVHAAKEHQYGPIGIFGSHSKTEISVSKVDKGSPSDGKLKKGTKIIGVNNAKFKSDVRKELAIAIDLAESKAGGGKLSLMVKGGKNIVLTLKVLGSYSATSPYKCPKTEAILKQAALVQFKVASPKNKNAKPKKHVLGRMYLELLGKMALGGKEAVKEYANYTWESSSKSHLYCSWKWGYRLLAMGEYYLLTGDKKVLPHIKTYAVALAKGQDAGGIWGHRMATKELNGRIIGYAQINQPSLVCFMAMVMAQKCGIDDPELKKGIERSYKFYSTFTGKGTFPYGVHAPNTREYNNNGMSASAALAMNFIGDKKAASFFSKLSTASHNTLENGHASTYFNPLWTPLGVSLSGPKATIEFFKESRWLYTMYRSWDGKITWDGKYRNNMGNVGAGILMSFCLARRNLYITGKEKDKSLWLSKSAAKKLIALPKIDYKKATADELLALLGHEMPQVRRAASWFLREKKGDLLPYLKKLIKGGTKNQKLGAISYFGYKCPKDIAIANMGLLGQILNNTKEDLAVRATAASCLSNTGEPARKYYADIISFLLEEKPDDFVGAIDQLIGRSLSTLSQTPLKDGLVTDKSRFYKAALKLTDHKRQEARASGLGMLAKIPLEDFHLIADKLIHIMKDKDTTYHSYHNPGNTVVGAITILANLNIKEGMQYALDIHNVPSGKWSFKMNACWRALTLYGANAKPALKKLKAMYKEKKIDTKNMGRAGRKYNVMLKAIENDKSNRKLISFEEAVKAGRK